ncbi:MAG: right-handed parallel beta-helix repeat-containing protein, partial [Patescibacteria group bacterium]
TVVPTETVTPTPTVTPEPLPPQAPSQWTFEKVELNKEYIAPQNSEVKLTFTKLPDPSGNIKIEEITLTEDQIKQTGSLFDKAYDITSDMKDGDFSYNLSLPIPESSKGKSVEVKFAEELSNIGSAEKVKNTLTKTDTSVSVSSLDHFTIFVVSGVTPPSCTGASITPPDGTTACYLTIQAAIDAASSDETINVAAGTYNEALTITTANLSIIGDGEDAVIINVAGKSGGSLQSGISVTAAGVTLQGFTLTSDGAAPTASPRYGIKFSGVNNGTIQHVTVRGLYRSGIDTPSVSGMTIDHVTSQNNGGNGLGLRDISNSTISNITTSGNTWGGVRIQTYYSTISGVVVSGTNNFQETAVSGVGGLYLEQSNVIALGPPYSITYGTSGSPNVLVQSADFSYAVHGNDNEAPQYSRIWLYKTLDDAKTAAALTSGQPSHITDNRYIESLIDDNWYVPSNLGSIQAAIDAASSGDTINVAAGIYTEALYIDKELTLTGAGRDITTIQAPTVLPSYAWNSGVNSLVAIDTTTVDISGFKIDGLHKGDGGDQFVGVHFWKSSGSIKDSKITGFRDSTLGGDQDGFGILVNHEWDVSFTQQVTIEGNTIDDYQKGGIVVTEIDSNATIKSNIVTGQGPTGDGQIAQNGIQIGYGANGTIESNTVTAHDYTPASWSASGILLTGTDGVVIRLNNVNNNEVGISLSEDEDYEYGGANNSEIALNNL